MDAGLFTEELSSVPLYRYNEKLRIRTSMEDRLPNLDKVDKTNKGIIEETEEAEETEPPIQPADTPVSDTKQDIESPPITVESPMFPRLEYRVSLQEADLKALKQSMDAGFSEIKEMVSELSVTSSEEDSKGNPISAPGLGSSGKTTEVESSTKVRMVQLVVDDPFTGLTGEEIRDLARARADVHHVGIQAKHERALRKPHGHAVPHE